MYPFWEVDRPQQPEDLFVDQPGTPTTNTEPVYQEYMPVQEGEIIGHQSKPISARNSSVQLGKVCGRQKRLVNKGSVNQSEPRGTK